MWKKWWLFYATDFKSLMYPCFTICRILGMFPYKINGSTFKISKPCYILSTVIICVYCIYDLTLIYDLTSKINLEVMFKIFEGVCYYTCSGFIMIITHILCAPRLRLIQTISKISSKLPPKSYQKLSRLIYVKDTLGIISVIVQVCIYYHNFYKTQMYAYLNVSAMIFTTYSILLIFQTNMLYINCVYVLKACFKNICDNLAHMQKLVVNDTKSCVVTMTDYMQKNQFLILELKVLQKRHLIVSDAVQMLNIIFSLQLLATIITIFSNITFELYFYIVRWQNGILINFEEHFFDIFLTSVTHHIIQITLLVWACETGKNQAQAIHTTIHDLLNNISDEQIKNEVKRNVILFEYFSENMCVLHVNAIILNIESLL